MRKIFLILIISITVVMIGDMLISSKTISFHMPKSFQKNESKLNTFTESEYDDELVRNGVGGRFRLIEGALGALIMVSMFLVGIVFTLFRKWKISFAFFALSAYSWVLRAIHMIYFSQLYGS